MRIAFITNFFHPFQTGSCNWGKEIVRHYAKQGHEVVIITVSPCGKFVEEDYEGIKLYRLPTRIRLPKVGFFLSYEHFYLIDSRKNRRITEEIFLKHDIQAAHVSNHLLDAIFLGNSVCKKLKVPRICTVHGAISHSGNRFYNAIMRLADKTVIQHTMNQYDAVIGLDREQKDYIDRTYKKTKRSPLLPLCGVDFSFFKKYPAVNLEKNAKNFPVKIASVGHVTENRNRLDLVRAASFLRNKGHDIEVHIIGKLLCRDAEELTKELGLTDCVKFFGEMEHSKMLEHLQGVDIECHLFFMPGLGCATLESMACGLPSIAYGYHGIYGDVPMKDGINIGFANPKDQDSVNQALLSLVENPGLRIAVGRNARELIRKHLTWEAVIGRYSSLLEELIPPQKEEQYGVESETTRKSKTSSSFSL
jgi:glycosyltransferase involved in cell wall biosynthesis